MADQVSWLDTQPSMTSARSARDHAERDYKQVSPEDHRKRAWGSLAILSTRAIVGRSSHETTLRPVITKIIYRACSLYDDSWRTTPHTATAGGDKKCLTGTCCTRHSSTVGVRRRDHVLEKVDPDNTPLRSPIRWWHASGSQLPLLNIRKKHSKSRQINTFPRYKYWFIDPNNDKLSLDPRNHICNYLICIHSIILCNLLHFYYQPLLCHYWLYHMSPFGRYHSGATPLSLATTWFPNIFSFESIRNVTILSNDFRNSVLHWSAWRTCW